MSSLVQKRNPFALTLITVTDEGEHEPRKVRGLGRRKGIDFMVLSALKSAIRLAEDLLSGIRWLRKGSGDL